MNGQSVVHMSKASPHFKYLGIHFHFTAQGQSMAFKKQSKRGTIRHSMLTQEAA
jgi:tRNA G46 methylase TrmB